MRIATYNFLKGGSKHRNGHWQRLREIAPHIALTQESRPDPEPNTFPHIHARAQQHSWGTGVCTYDIAIDAIDVAGFDGWVVGGQLHRSTRMTTRPIRVFSIHCPAGEHGYIKEMHRILDALQPIARRADLVLGGDFNVAAGYRGDGEGVKMSRGEKELLDRLTREFKLMACWQTAHPAVPLAQTLRWTGNRAAPYHCDGIFAPQSWRPKLRSCEVISGPEWDRLSDHNPVVAEFEM